MYCCHYRVNSLSKGLIKASSSWKTTRCLMNLHWFHPSRWMQRATPTHLMRQFCKQSRAAGCTATAATRRPRPSWWRRHRPAAPWCQETCRASCCSPRACRPPSSQTQLKANKRPELDERWGDVSLIVHLMHPYCRCWVASPTTRCGGWNLKTTAAPEQNDSPSRFQWSKYLYCCLEGKEKIKNFFFDKILCC